ncbi:MAG TPA: GNAT family N-acetyltransferase [Bacteroidia bacterium]|nr:GNAT family N-acetyltransferase [Bacteroidia bacterium]
MEFLNFQGVEIQGQFEALAALRIRVFRDFPYLYEGHLDYEREYLKTYSNAPKAFLMGAFYRKNMVGATTCIPLEDETEEVKKPFWDAGMNVGEIFYFGESILLPEYRGLGIGNRFFDAREAHAASFGTYKFTCFCAVQRPADHPARPADYQPLDPFWTKRGYRRVPELVSQFEWLDIGERQPTSKPMVYWMRPI